MYYLIFFIDNF